MAHRPRPTEKERGYDYEHVKLRKAMLPYAYGKLCHFCGEVMRRGQRLALDHTVDRTGYRGMVHSSCNSRDGGKRGAAVVNAQRGLNKWHTSQDW